MTAPELEVTICDLQFANSDAQLKHEIGRESVNIALYSLIQGLCLHLIQGGELAVEHGLVTTNDEDVSHNDFGADERTFSQLHASAELVVHGGMSIQ